VGNTAANSKNVTLIDWLIAAVMGLGFSLAVWWGLAIGGGLVGGDTFTYFLPQKLILAESFARGEIPRWHPLTGLGYPLLAESQTGVFYPPYQILYRITDVNTAYNACVLLHYWLAFLFTWRFARCQGLTNAGGYLAATVFVYGWFPARISHEWSIVGGVWFPLTLWLTDRLILVPSRRRFALLSACLATHLLAGHFTLAFINQLTILAYTALKLWMGVPREGRRIRLLQGSSITVFAILMALGVSAVQLVPTYELKRASQRKGGATQAFDPSYGHMPPVYATQLFASWWYWHSPEILSSREMMKTPGIIAADSNHVEAHLYWGLVPLALILCLFSRQVRAKTDELVCRTWLIMVTAALIYATGWLMPLTRHLPGFGFFNGPGRYTIICAFGGGILAGLVLDGLTSKWRRHNVLLLTAVLIAVTIPDLLKSSRFVADAIVVSESPLNRLEKSWLRNFFVASQPMNHRLLAPGPNVANLFGVSCVPQYLGLGPAVYVEDRLNPPTGPESIDVEYPSSEESKRLTELGITHVLTTEAIERPSQAIRLMQQFPDAVLNAIWGRGSQPCYLYELTAASGRVVTEPREAMESFEFVAVSPNSVSFRIDLLQDADVVLRDLMYPGWGVTVDGLPANSTSGQDPIMRSTRVSAGKHVVEWSFQSAAVQTGIGLSAVFGGVLCFMLFCSMDTIRPRKQSLK